MFRPSVWAIIRCDLQIKLYEVHGGWGGARVPCVHSVFMRHLHHYFVTSLFMISYAQTCRRGVALYRCILRCDVYVCCSLGGFSISRRTAPSAPKTRPMQRLSRSPTIQKLGAKKPYAATQHLTLLMIGVCTRNMSS